MSIEMKMSRDYFAGMALPTCIDIAVRKASEQKIPFIPTDPAELAYAIADAMVKERDK